MQWSNDRMLMRRYHRWFSFPLILFVLAVTITGVYLQAVEIIAEAGKPEATPAQRTAPGDPAEITAALEQALTYTEQARPGFPIQKIELSWRGGVAQAVVSTNQRIGPSVTVDLGSNEATYVERPPRTLRTIFILLHSGKYYGQGGLVLIMLAGISLMVLSVTGLWVYVDMWRRRRKANKRGFFWR
jgi:uncharacterized iron-regulated membrane protein